MSGAYLTENARDVRSAGGDGSANRSDPRFRWGGDYFQLDHDRKPASREARRRVLRTVSNIGGESKTMRAENEPVYSAIYELENPAVLTSPEWNDAVEAGRWPAQVRPYTRNRRHVLLKMRSHAD